VIRLDSVSKRFANGTVAVTDLSLNVEAGEIAILVGPSGCGKTTVLRMINRLIEPTSGRIFLDDDDVTTVDPVGLRRRIGYVIQQVGLFPHQTVRRNVGTVCRLRGWEKSATDERSDEMLTLVGLDPATFGGRYPHQLSGGQRQRVGVARALASKPPVLVMDEPFGAVDPIARDLLQVEFLKLQRELGTTTVIVTHDIDEAVRLGDRIAVMKEGGYLEQYASPGEVLGNPATDFVAQFVGADRLLKLMAVTDVEHSELAPDQPGTDLPTLPEAATLRDATMAILGSPEGKVRVVDAADGALGVLTLDGVRQMLTADREQQTPPA
jgi:osmoprotectant transport system ATP-binding protein